MKKRTTMNIRNSNQNKRSSRTTKMDGRTRTSKTTTTRKKKKNDDDHANAPQKKNDDNENGANKFQKQQKMPFEDDNKIKKFAHSNDLIEQIGQKKGQQFRR